MRSTKPVRWARSASEGLQLYRLNIRPRLTLCFVSIIAMMLLGNITLLWQFHRAQTQVKRLSAFDQELIAVLQAHVNLMSFYERLDVLANSEDTGALVEETESLREALLKANLRSKNVLSQVAAEVQLDPSLLPSLQAIQGALPAQLEAIGLLAKSGAWDATRLRLANQVRPLESRSSVLVESIDRAVVEERARALLNISQTQRSIFMVVSASAILTLLFAAFLGVAITHSIAKPLRRLMEGSAALARGDFSYRVPADGKDEIARVGRDFNEMVVRLQELYHELQRKGSYLAEAQQLSHTGSFGWNVSSGEIFWSAETFRIFELESNASITIELILQRTHPEDRLAVRELIERASRERTEFDFEHRLLMPDQSVKYLRVVGRPSSEEGNSLEFVGAVTDISERQRAHNDLQNALKEIRTLKDQLYQENIALREEIDKASMFEEIVGESTAVQTVLLRVSKVAPTESTVLITGETGTGKELVARAIHKRSERSKHVFVSVNCAAIPPSLIASELFGHEKGGFTGAVQRRLGRFELAEGGTLFLDEVGELPSETQIALLRVLQEREFERVGGNKAIRANVRVIAATNRNLQAAIDAGSFRSDLYYRLNVFPIEVPPLRKRRADIPLLVAYFIDRYGSKTGKKIRTIDTATLERLMAYNWPGNVRELQNIIERSIIVCETEKFRVDESWLTPAAVETAPSGRPLFRMSESDEKKAIEAALADAHGRVSGPAGAAAKLGIPASTLDSKIKILKINKHQFKTKLVHFHDS